MKYTGLSETPGINGAEGDEYVSLVTKKKSVFKEGKWAPVRTIFPAEPVPVEGPIHVVKEPTVPTPKPVTKPRSKKKEIK